MKEVHLICNAHIDPIWQWAEDEGVFAAISTFRSAVELCKEFDYIFCHNEAILYKYIKRYAPDLFEEIKELVRVGKWHIMGGWYLQPDCNMPSGESFVRQILVGRQFFMEEFGKAPTTAINFDPFGHTRGLVQIMSKCGQDSYIITRPNEHQCPIGDSNFWWEGFDGSRIKVNRNASYNSALGHAAEHIERRIKESEDDKICVLWGVGNHGGGPSRKDLSDIRELINRGDATLLHSTPEAYFAEINPKTVYKESLHISMPGCYTTMSKLKSKYIELENTLYTTEKICAVADAKGLMEYPKEKLNEAIEDMLSCEFHDVLPGTSIKAGEDNGLHLIGHAMKILIDLRAQAMFALSREMEPAKEGTFPVLVFNPHAYEWKTNIICEFSLADQNWDDSSISDFVITDKNGKKLPMQVIKEESNLNLDWRKRIIFEGVLAPLSVSRFDIAVKFVPKKEKSICSEFTYCDKEKQVEIDPKTGLLTRYFVKGVDYLNGGITPMLFSDNADPWAMGESQLKRLGTNGKPFSLIKNPKGIFKGMNSVQVIEDGPIYRAIEAFLEKDNNRIRLEYRIYKKSNQVDIHADVFFNDSDRMLKLQIPLANDGKYMGGTAFGTEELYKDGRECVAQRFVAVDNGKKPLAILTNCQYASSYENKTVYLSLLRGATYCAHPIGDRPLLPENRFIKKIDQGLLAYDFRLTPANSKDFNRLALEFNQTPYTLNVFPITPKKSKDFSITISNKNITLEAFKKADDQNGYIMRLYNGSGNKAETDVLCGGKTEKLIFGKYEVKTLLYSVNSLKELTQMKI